MTEVNTSRRSLIADTAKEKVDILPAIQGAIHWPSEYPMMIKARSFPKEPIPKHSAVTKGISM